MSQSQCAICETEDAQTGRRASTEAGWHDGAWFDCPQCGEFVLDDDARSEIKRRSIDPRLVSAWIRQRHDQGVNVVIRRQDVDRLVSLVFPTFKERVESYLLAAATRSKTLSSKFDPRDPPFRAAGYCTPQEMSIMEKHLEGEAYLVLDMGNPPAARLTPRGHLYVDELRARHAASSQGFIAMWFAEEMEVARREGLEEGIRNAGYKPHRVDDAQHIDKIDDRIIAEIRRSKFLVADLTGHRGGVYYEAGFAHGLGKPVFYTCRSDDTDAIHFDIRQFNDIKWVTPAALAVALQARIEAVLGAGPEVSRGQRQ